MYSFKDIEQNIGCAFDVLGDATLEFSTFESIFDARTSSLCWLRATGDPGRKMIEASSARYIICAKFDVPVDALVGKCLIQVDKPQVALMRLVKNLRTSKGVPAVIHPTAIVSERAVIGESVAIGPYAVIGQCTIGDGCSIKAHATIHDGVQMGRNVLISEYCNIGGEGFGHIRNEVNVLENMLHIGSVVIEDDVEIFPFTNVDKGTLGSTRIGSGTKIDHYCHIGHNSQIGRNTVITPNVTTLGGVHVGDDCVIGCATVFRDASKVGNGVTVGMGSMVTKNIPDNETWVGAPARQIDEFKMLQRKLGEL